MAQARKAREGAGVCVITAARNVTPRMRRITFTGPGLHGTTPTGPDQRVKLSFPIARRFTGDAGEAAAARRKRRTYTLLHLDPEAGTAVVDFVLHPGGVAATWAATAETGDELMLTAPVGGYVAPADADQIVLIADETGLPALQAIAASLDVAVPVRAYAEIHDSAEQQPVSSSSVVEVEWMPRDGAAHGSHIAALAARLIPTVGEKAAFWIAGEAAGVRTLRNALITEAGLDRHRIDAVAYWTRGR